MEKSESINERFAYDPKRDISPVDQFGFVDLRDAFANHSLPGTLVSSDESFNGVEDPASLLGKSADVFDAYRKAQYVKSAESAAAAAAKVNADAASSAVSD